MNRSPIAFRIQKYLRGLHYPVQKDEAVAHARARGAEQELLEALEALSSEDLLDSPITLSRRVSERLARRSRAAVAP
jgi:hypothetical protein